MKNLLLLICFFAVVVVASAQNKEQAAKEKRARELHRVMGLSDQEQWKKFMKENYSREMLERPVTTKTKTGESESTSKANTETADTFEQKVKMFERLHNDFGKSKIKSLKAVGERIDMTLENSNGLTGDFKITYEDQSPFLINRIAVEVVRH